MKKILLILISFLALSSCDNDIDINADYKNLSVIYAVLDHNADTNYVRVQRGYLGDAPASQSFDETDSLYYDTANIEVYLREFDNDAEDFNYELPLIYDESKTLEEGTFTAQGHYVFRIDTAILRDKEYEVVVVRADGSEAKARTGVVGTIDIVRPVTVQAGRVFNGQIEFDYRNGTAPFRRFLPIIYFSYREVDLTTKVSTYKTEEIRLTEQNASTGDVSLFIASSQFASIIGGRLEEDPNIIRFFTPPQVGGGGDSNTVIEVKVWGAAEELVTYYELNEPSSGINQNRPDFEQVSNGTGLVSSRTSKSRGNISLETNRFLRDLRYSDATCGLNFVEIVSGVDTCFCVQGQQFCL